MRVAMLVHKRGSRTRALDYCVPTLRKADGRNPRAVAQHDLCAYIERSMDVVALMLAAHVLAGLSVVVFDFGVRGVDEVVEVVGLDGPRWEVPASAHHDPHEGSPHVP